MFYKKEKIIYIIFLSTLLLCIGLFVKRFEKVSVSIPDIIVDKKETHIKAWQDTKTGEYYYFLPSYVEVADVGFDIEASQKLVIDGEKVSKEEASGRLCTNNVIKISFDNGSNTKRIVFMKSENVATMYVQTATGTMTNVLKKKGNKENAKVTVINSIGDIELSTAESIIKGRGNTTWDFPKKPFSISFTSKEEILGMKGSSKWILLANSIDNSMLRNKLVLDAAKKVGLEGTSECEYIELYLNGEYAGLYLLCQSPETWYERCDIDDNGLYLFKTEILDRYKNADSPILIQDEKVLVDICLPKNISSEQNQEAERLISAADEVIMSGDDSLLGDMVDIDSWAKKYLIDEVFENYDSGLASSYFYKVGNDTKLYAGPIWDYDNCMGNSATYAGATTNPRILYAKNDYRRQSQKIQWYSELYENTEFLERVKKYYAEVIEPLIYEDIEGEIDRCVGVIELAKTNNNKRWAIETKPEDVDYIKDYMKNRAEFLHDIWLDNIEYCAVKYYAFGEDSLFRWIYVKKGESLNGSEDYHKWIGNTTLFYKEDSGDVYDLDAPINEDIALLYGTKEKSGSGIKQIINSGDKILLIIASFLLLSVLYLILHLALNKRRRL